MRRLLTGLLGASLLLGACSDDGDDDRAAVTSIPDQTSSTTTTEKPAIPPPDVIPTDTSLITEEYVEQVLNELSTVSLQTLISVRDEGVVGEDAIALVEATHSNAVVAQQINDLIDATYGGIDDLRPDPRPMVFTVIDLLATHSTCIVAEVQTSADELLKTPSPTHPDERDFVRLYPATDEQRASGLNPTAWVIDQFPVTLDGSVPELTCP